MLGTYKNVPTAFLAIGTKKAACEALFHILFDSLFSQ